MGPPDDFKGFEKYEWLCRREAYWQFVRIIPEAGVWQEFHMLHGSSRWRLTKNEIGCDTDELWATGERLIDKISGGIWNGIH